MVLTSGLKKIIGTKAFYKAALAFAIPLILQDTVSSFVNLLDNMMIGSLGTEQMSGVAIQNNKPAICILTVPTSAAVDYAKQASENGVAAIWNFANVDLSTLGLEAAVENVNLMDSLYTLTYYSRDGE